MTLKECYQILGLDQSASLDDVKHAYRQRAFELHPDLNPGLADASQQFQKLNESYVILSKIITLREAREGGKKKTAESRAAQAARSAGSADRTERPATDSGNAGKDTQDASRSTKGTEASREKAASATSDPEDGRTSGRDSASGSEGKEAGTHPDAAGQPSGQAEAAGAREEKAAGAASGENVYAEQQEVLKDILNDPFARRVFEDIYSEIRKKVPPRPESKEKSQSAPRRVSRPRATTPPPIGKLGRIGLGWGQHKISLDFSKGFGGALKDWLRSQIDEEQLFELPAKRLVPGARIRLQIRHGFSDDVTTLDVTLPPDFRLDKSIRLKGMGKKLGRWQGDLYLRFSSKD